MLTNKLRRSNLFVEKFYEYPGSIGATLFRQKNDHEKWLMGVPIGEEINSELNPTLL
ncbi:hypothetical protein SAMN05216524_104463 [Mucilaginibacter sp. OK098]|nr:hypothetical protein SAMN05216524_104463 [Mucilaginibacter sp. OK098]